jgi:tRNA-2-methylthio-N6-dimethylallyladenosine synthase
MARYGEKLLKKYPILTEVVEAGSTGFDAKPKRVDKNNAFVQISTGCNSFCTYCVVPYARGREISRPLEDILKEINGAVADGHSEITLLGQNVNSWGLEKISIGSRKQLLSDKDFSKEDLPTSESGYLPIDGLPPFVKLLQEISKIDGVKKIRFMTSNPWDFHDELIEEIINNKKIDRFLHLPVQSGSNSVLKRMNRGYTRDDFLEIINKLRKGDPKITFGTDIIVGFCGETAEDFEQTVDLVKQVGFLVGFVAMYSPRPSTASIKLYPDDVPHIEKKRRFEILDKIINKDNLAQRPKIV